MYENRHGRFTAVDPLLASGKSADPQTFNRYVYVMNNPLVLTDPTGLQAGENLDDPNRPADHVVYTVSRSWWSKVKEGFNQLVRSVIGRDNWYHDENIANEERKRSDVETQVGNAVKNYAKGVDELNQAVEYVDPTGVAALNRTTVNNSLVRASDEEVWWAMSGAAFNTAMTIYTPGKAFKVAQEGGKHAGFLKNYFSRGMKEINSAMESLQTGKRGIGVHLDKIANPSKYVKDWDSLRKQHQESLIRNWQKEIVNAREQIEILKGILSGR